jgi:hypothetical protein
MFHFKPHSLGHVYELNIVDNSSCTTWSCNCLQAMTDTISANGNTNWIQDSKICQDCYTIIVTCQCTMCGDFIERELYKLTRVKLRDWQKLWFTNSTMHSIHYSFIDSENRICANCNPICYTCCKKPKKLWFCSGCGFKFCRPCFSNKGGFNRRFEGLEDYQNLCSGCHQESKCGCLPLDKNKITSIKAKGDNLKPYIRFLTKCHGRDIINICFMIDLVSNFKFASDITYLIIEMVYTELSKPMSIERKDEIIRRNAKWKTDGVYPHRNITKKGTYAYGPLPSLE